MKRASCFITNIQIKDGPVLHIRPGEQSYYLTCNGFAKEGEWIHNLSTELMIPKEGLSFMLCSDVKLATLLRDEETDEFYNFGQEIITDKLIGLTVRQFITANIFSLDKSFQYKGFVLADLKF
jgi:hypothetical protein